MSNSISFVGRLGGDAEAKKVGDYDLLEFRVANNVGYGDKQTTNWFTCQKWGKIGKLADMLKKGTQVFVTGELCLRPYTTKDGAERVSNDIRISAIDLVGSKNDSQQAPAATADDGGIDVPF